MPLTIPGAVVLPDMVTTVKNYQAYLFDLDGTVYLGDEILPGALETINSLSSGGAHIRYVTNNPTNTPENYARKLRGLGVTADVEQVVTSITATIAWLTSNAPESFVFPIGEQPLVDALETAGIPVSEDPAEIDIVLASFDRTFDYRKLQIGFDALWFHGRAELMATNPDMYCPYPGGWGEPDAGAIIAALEASTGVRTSRVFGKPSPLLAQMALGTIPHPPQASDVIFVGDRLATDIAMGQAAGMDTALVLTGDSTREEAAALPVGPTWIIDGLPGLLTGH